MKWVALIIAACLGAYTLFTLATLDNRKAARNTHEPWAEAKNRAATAQRLETVGYKLTSATTERPANASVINEAITLFRASISSAPAGIPDKISAQLAGQPKLADSFSLVAAPASANTKEPYQILYTCQLPDNQKLLGDTAVYIKADDLVVVTNFHGLDEDLRARTKDTSVLLSLPGTTFTPGRTYNITLVGRNESRQWSVLAH